MSVSTCMRRLLRLDFCVRAALMWRFMPGPAFTLPVAVILNRFLTDDLVFILGILFSFLAAARGGRRRSRPGLPLSRARRAIRRRGVAAGGGGSKVTGRHRAGAGTQMRTLPLRRRRWRVVGTIRRD